MANFNPYIDKIDMDFWRELCTKEGKLCHYKRGNIFFIAEIRQGACGDLLRKDISNTPLLILKENHT